MVKTVSFEAKQQNYIRTIQSEPVESLRQLSENGEMYNCYVELVPYKNNKPLSFFRGNLIIYGEDTAGEPTFTDAGTVAKRRVKWTGLEFKLVETPNQSTQKCAVKNDDLIPIIKAEDEDPSSEKPRAIVSKEGDIILKDIQIKTRTNSNLPNCKDNNDVSTWTDCFGTYTNDSGDKYVGEWKVGKFNGKGTLMTKDRGNYVGEWKDNIPEGRGTITLPDGNKIVAEFKDAKPFGEVVIVLANGDTFYGKARDDEIYGQSATYANGDRYVGQFKDEFPDGVLRHGQGTQTYADGSTYVGEWKNDKRNGQGIFERKTVLMNMVQDGTWIDDVFQEEEPPAAVVNELGQTVCPGSPYDTAQQSNITQDWTDCVGKEYWEYAGGGSYSGGYKNGRWHGLGTFIKQPGEKYIGEWSDGFKNGEGIQTYPDGTMEEGTWKDDTFNP